MFAFDCVPSTVYYPDVSPVMDNKSLSTGHISVSCEAARDRLTRSPARVPFRGVTSGSVPGTNGWGSACVRATGLADASFKRRINCGMAGSSSPLRDLTSAGHQMARLVAHSMGLQRRCALTEVWRACGGRRCHVPAPIDCAVVVRSMGLQRRCALTEVWRACGGRRCHVPAPIDCAVVVRLPSG